MSSSDAAPSEIDEELAAVTVPPSGLNAGRIVGILSRRQLNGSSSLSTVVVLRRAVTSTGTISSSKAPLSIAASARSTDAVANASCAWRVKPYLSAVFSAKWPMSLPSNGLCRPS